MIPVIQPVSYNAGHFLSHFLISALKSTLTWNKNAGYFYLLGEFTSKVRQKKTCHNTLGF